MSSLRDLNSPETAYLGLASQANVCRRFATKREYRLAPLFVIVSYSASVHVGRSELDYRRGRRA